MRGALTLVALAVSLSPSAAGAKPVELTLRFQAELTCGQPGTTPLVVQLPAAASVPASIAPAAARVNGKPAAAVAVAVAGHRVTVTPRRPPGVICQVIGPGPIAIRFTAAAGLGNPPRPGSYAVSVQRGRARYRATVRITG